MKNTFSSIIHPLLAVDIKSHIVAYNISVFSNFRNLVENEEIDVNVRDKWDSTPL